MTVGLSFNFEDKNSGNLRDNSDGVGTLGGAVTSQRGYNGEECCVILPSVTSQRAAVSGHHNN